MIPHNSSAARDRGLGLSKLKLNMPNNMPKLKGLSIQVKWLDRPVKSSKYIPEYF